MFPTTASTIIIKASIVWLCVLNTLTSSLPSSGQCSMQATTSASHLASTLDDILKVAILVIPLAGYALEADLGHNKVQATPYGAPRVARAAPYTKHTNDS